MLSKIIKLEEAKEKYIVSEDSPYYDYQIGQFMQYTIEAFKTLTDEIMKLQAKVKKLEQKDSYYPTEEEISSIKVGGTD